MRKKIERYSDIINLPHHQSIRRPRMPVHNRAAQFAPFAALTGYNSMIRNTADILLLEKRVVLDDDWKNALDYKLQTLSQNQTKTIKVTYFDKTTNELGGTYTEYEGLFQKVKELPKRLAFLDGTEICTEDIVDILF